MRRIIFTITLLAGLLSVSTAHAERVDSISSDRVNDISSIADESPAKRGSWRVDSLNWRGEFTGSLSGGKYTPFWLVNNTHGIGSLKKNNFYLRASMKKEMDRSNRFSWGAGIDLIGGYRMQSPFTIHQLYGEIRYRCLDLMIGQKEIDGAISNPRLSSGNLLYSGNAMPIPQIRAGIFDYADIWGTKGWLGIKGYVAFGMFTDSKWLRDWSKPEKPGEHAIYPENVKYHSKGLWLRNGNPDKFPLTAEVGIEMATQFGGGGWMRNSDGSIDWVRGTGGLKGLWHAFVPQPGGNISGELTNVDGNFLGNWTFAASWAAKDQDWGVKIYYQHMFEDHSMLYIEYPWRDGLWGVEGKLPENPFVSRIVYEFLYMKDQTGPVYWDTTDRLPVQVSGRDQYYWHAIYGAWQHWGMIIGNPLVLSPIYNDGTLLLKSNRIIAHHIGFEGNPTNEISYRVLASYQRSWGTYKDPLPEVADNFNFMAEVKWRPRRLAGWEGSFSLGADGGDLIGRSIGMRISIAKSGLIRF